MNKSLLSLMVTAVIAVAASSLASSQARAEIEYPWCGNSPAGQSTGPKCTNTSLEQCQAALFGMNGWCTRNSQAVWREQQGSRRSVR
jgi:hypothetical protein